MLTDIITACAAYCITVGVVILWVCISKQEAVPCTVRTVVGISLRVLLLFLLLFIICDRLALNMIWVLSAMASIVFASFILPFVEGFPGIGVMTIPYIAQQWILGWPDRPRVLEPPSRDKSETGRLEQFVGSVGMTSCPLRPVGMVALGDNEYQAHSDSGYVERGTKVRVVGWQGAVLSVRPVESDYCGCGKGELE